MGPGRFSGFHLGEKHHWRKFALWEEASRSALMMVVPGVTRPGLRSQRSVSLIDVYPTLVDLCGLHGRSGRSEFRAASGRSGRLVG